MSYFSRFPFVSNYKIQGQSYTGMDITRRTGVSKDDKENPAIYLDYDIGESETPTILADRLYDDSSLYWVILLFNEIFDIEEDWPLTQVALDQYVTRVYDDPNGIHHYESAATGAWVDEELHPDYDTIPVTNYEHELNLNEAKRKIKLPTPDYVGQIVAEHNRLIRL